MAKIVQVATFADIETEFIRRVHRVVWCNVATLDSQNRPRSRILHPIWEVTLAGLVRSVTAPRPNIWPTALMSRWRTSAM
jgi:hypothetical protein